MPSDDDTLVICSFRVPRKLRQRLRQHALRHAVSVQTLVTRLIETELKAPRA